MEWVKWVKVLCESRLETNTRLCSLRNKTSGCLGLRAFSLEVVRKVDGALNIGSNTEAGLENL